MDPWLLRQTSPSLGALMLTDSETFTSLIIIFPPEFRGFDVSIPSTAKLKRFVLQHLTEFLNRCSRVQTAQCISPNGMLKITRTTRCTESRRSIPITRMSTSEMVLKAVPAMEQALHWRKSGHRFWLMFSRTTHLFSVITTWRTSCRLRAPLKIS